MWRCSRIMHMQRELHPTLLSSLEGIVDQMVWFRENWHEEVCDVVSGVLASCGGDGLFGMLSWPCSLETTCLVVYMFVVGLNGGTANTSGLHASAALILEAEDFKRR